MQITRNELRHTRMHMEAHIYTTYVERPYFLQMLPGACVSLVTPGGP